MAIPRSRRRRGIAPVVIAAVVGGMALVAPGTANAVGPDPAPDNLILHYDFEGDLSGGVVDDSSPSGLDGKLINPASATQVASVDGTRALRLPGGATNSSTAPYVSIPNGLFKDLRATTISTWLKWSGGPDFQWVYNLGKDLDTATFVTPSFSGDSRTRSSIKPVNGSSEVGVSGSQKLPADQWVNLATTIDGTTITYYLNGAKVGGQQATIDLAARMYSATNTTSGYLGKPFWSGHPFLAGELDDFRVYDTAFTAAQVAQLAGDRLATLRTVSRTSFAVTTTTGNAPGLPAAVDASYSDGIDRALAITWNPVDPAAYAKRGEFTVGGTIAELNKPVTATVTVVAPGDLVVDAGTDTGAFHGGASGTLYGLYGEGLPSRNLIEGMSLRTVSTKAQDGPQHPGADALEVVKPLADSTDGDVYIYMTDIYRGFPYQWPGDTPEARLRDYQAKMAVQVDQVRSLDAKYRDNVVFVPFNEPEGNMFGTGEWSYNGTSWLTDPQPFFRAWDDAVKMIKSKLPDARIAGPNTSVLYTEIQGFLKHAVAAGTLPEVMTWHELSAPAQIRTNVAKYRAWEDQIFAGTAHAGKHLPININEYAYNYHTSVPGQMIQWVSAIEESKVDADIAYWNIDGNLSDSAVQANRANGQWWLLNAYGQMSGRTIKVTPPRPDVSYTMQGVATLDKAKAQARVLFGGSAGDGRVRFTNLDRKLFGDTVHAIVQEIPWTGQLGDSAQPRVVGELDQKLVKGEAAFDFGSALPRLRESSAYQIILTPGTRTNPSGTTAPLWQATYEAEDAGHTGTGYSRNGPEGSPSDVAKFYTSGGYNVGGLRTGSNVVLDFDVTVPQDGTYDLSVFANSLNTAAAVTGQGPTNVFLRVDGAAEQELHLTLGYKWVVWDHTDTTVRLTKGNHVISLAARSLDGTRATNGDAIIDKIDLALPNPAAAQATYEAENATLSGAKTDYSRRDASGSGVTAVGRRQSATFWVYSADDGESTLSVDTLGGGKAALAVNGRPITDVTTSARLPVLLSGGVNKVTVTGRSGKLLLDRIRVADTGGALVPAWYEAEDAARAGTAEVTSYSLASGGKAVTGVGGEPGNGNTVSFDVTAKSAGTYALTVRYSNPEQSPATHYNPDPLARRADISVNGGEAQRVLFPHSFHANNFWELTVPVTLRPGHNIIRFASAELPNFDGTTYISDQYEQPLRSRFAPVIDKIAITPYSDTTAPVVRVTTPRPLALVSGTVTVSGTAIDDRTSVDKVRVSLNGVRSTVAVDAPVVDGKWTAELDAGRLAPGLYTVTAGGADRADNQSDTGLGVLVIVTRRS